MHATLLTPLTRCTLVLPLQDRFRAQLAARDGTRASLLATLMSSHEDMLRQAEELQMAMGGWLLEKAARGCEEGLCQGAAKIELRHRPPPSVLFNQIEARFTLLALRPCISFPSPPFPHAQPFPCL